MSPLEEAREEQRESAAGTAPGNYFVSNYPPYSTWTARHVPRAHAALAGEPRPDVPLGFYVHLPFCRKRCEFCYFKVYTDKNGREIRRYLDALERELARYVESRYLSGRTPTFLYFGGGTPSYLSTQQLEKLFGAMRRLLPWERMREVTFECEPGTLQPHKIRTLRDLGVTRLSLGVESFDSQILELNGRAHRSREILSAWEAARGVGFPQVNLDLIAGMVGESEAGWRAGVARALALGPESVTIYQMEVPYNTELYRHMRDGGREVAPVPDWETKRRWVGEAFAAFEDAGYRVGSAYTVVRPPEQSFLYRDALWHGADLVGIGVSSFSHVGGVHFQNEHSFEPYLRRVEAGELPILRALVPTAEERMIREFVLQLKLGRVETRPFAEKFGVDLVARFRDALERQRDAGWLEFDSSAVRVTRPGLLRIDGLLWDFFLEEHRDVRYA